MTHEIFELLERLPLDLIYEVKTGTLAPSGYGAHRHYFIRIIAVYEECRKCGYNTFNPDEALNNHRHSWKWSEKTLEKFSIKTIEDEEKAKQIISKYMNL